MTRRVGAHARDAGSTTGVATACLALLSAGTLATLGVVTADQLRDGGPGQAPDVKLGDVAPPTAIALTPSAAPRGPGGGGGGRGGGNGGVESLPEALPEAVVGGAVGTPGPSLSGTGGTPAPGPAAPTPGTPAVAEPPGPVFTGVVPPPTPSTDVLGEKRGKHLGQLKKSATPVHRPHGRAVGYRHGHGAPATTAFGPNPERSRPATAGASSAARDGKGRAKGTDKAAGAASTDGPPASHGNGHGTRHGSGHGKGHGPADLPVPFSPLPAPAAAVPQPAPAPHGKALGHTTH